MAEVLDEVLGCRDAWELSVISAHRNTEQLAVYIGEASESGVKVFICAAGMSAALPGAVAAELPLVPVIGVPLPSTQFTNCMDSLLSMLRMPPGTPVAVPGLATSGLLNAAIQACQIIAVGDEQVKSNLSNFMAKQKALKSAQIGISPDKEQPEE
jgi:5-(carboxyamino)imidazole ribonucleotide mutase